MHDFPFTFNAVLVSTCPVQQFPGKKDPERVFRRWCVLVRLDNGQLVVVSDWDPPAVLPEISFGTKVRVDFNETQRAKDIPGAWAVRGCVIPIK